MARAASAPSPAATAEVQPQEVVRDHEQHRHQLVARALGQQDVEGDLVLVAAAGTVPGQQVPHPSAIRMAPR